MATHFTIQPKKTSAEQIFQINRIADFCADRVASRHVEPVAWAQEREHILSALLDYALYGGTL